jgi:hypothetical protein
MPAPVYTPVKSSNIASVGYDLAAQQLYVRFNNGSEYRYDGVPVDESDAMISDLSPGSYFNDNIKGQYPYRRV